MPMRVRALKRYDYSWLQNSALNSLPKSLTHTDKSAWHHPLHVGKGGDKHKSYRRSRSRVKIDSAFTSSPVLEDIALSCQTRASVQRSPYAGAETGHCEAWMCPAMGCPSYYLSSLMLVEGAGLCPKSAKPLLICPTAQPRSHRHARCWPSNEPLSSPRTGQPPRAPFAL